MDTDTAEILEESLGHQFKDPSLLECALTHPSWSLDNDKEGSDNYQRLEFLGDSVLALVLAEKLYHLYPDEREGMMAKARAALAKGSVLAKLAREAGIDQCIRLGASEAQSGGRNLISAQEDACEAVIGALYLDGGLDAARNFLLNAYGDFNEAVKQALANDNPKGRLQEWAQARDPENPPEYRVIEENGPDHQKSFAVVVLVDGSVSGNGVGRSKKEAEENAARSALESLGE
ncbi:ribonuclease III [Rubellicoccus peritrichatus]|uniref:Ribonuclease 3 n=1 Tax=Rubellicoccus peritrichatus TaxID=3080537 RepID=A0AAQ3L5I4_9BACT|nr:ribonuclease III [Puniceicoccus sp. CR14]WOO39261.1 ribonuclease III [Puniceicoccus sp. CR14]